MATLSNTAQPLSSQETLQDFYFKLHQENYVTQKDKQESIRFIQEFNSSQSKHYLILDTHPLSQLYQFTDLFSGYFIFNEQSITIQSIDKLLSSTQNKIVLDLKSEAMGAKMTFLISLVQNKESIFEKVIIYSNKYNSFVEHLIKSFKFSSRNNNIHYLEQTQGLKELQTVKYEQDFQRIQEEIVILERRIRVKNKFSKCNVIIFARDSYHSSKIRKQLSMNSQIVSRMNIYCEGEIHQAQKSETTSNIFIVSNSQLFSAQEELINNCYMIVDFGFSTQVYFSNELHSFQEIPYFISKNEIFKRQNFLTSNYPGFVIRVYQKSSFLRSNTNDIDILMLKEGNLYNYLCKKYHLKSHFFPQNNNSNKQSEDSNKISLFYENEEDILQPSAYHKHYLPVEEQFLRSILAQNASIINKESYESEKNIVFSLLQNHIWSKDGLIQTLYNFRTQISSDQKISKQQIVCHKSCINPLFSSISNIPSEPYSELIQKYINSYPKSLFVFSGNKKKGYINLHSGESFQVSLQCPLKVYSEYPQMILVHYMIQEEDVMKIQDYTKIEVDDIPDNFNQKIEQKIEQTKIELVKQYFDISTLLFDTVWINSGSLINAFQDEYNCIIKADPILDTISLYNIVSSGNEQFTTEQKMESFERILFSSKDSLINEKIEFNYYNNVKLSLKKGGLIERIIKNNECFTFQIDNVPLSMSMENLTEWISEYSDIISIKPIEKVTDERDFQSSNSSSQQIGISYVIQVEDKDDVNFFIEVFDETEMDSNTIKIKKIQNDLKNKQLMDGVKMMEECIGVRMKWYNLKCEGPALIEYEDSIKCDQVWEILSKEKNFSRKDETTIQYKYSKGGLNYDNEVDWVEFVVAKCNLIPSRVSINREKKPDHLKQESFVKYIITNNITPNCVLLNFNKYSPETSKKSAKIQLLLESDIKKVVEKYHKATNVIGCTKCFVSPFYYYTHQIDSSIRNQIKHSIEQDDQINISIQQKKCKITFLTQENELGQNYEVIRMKAKDINLFQVFKQKVIQYIEGSQIIISKDKFSISKLNSSEGKLFLSDMNTLFNCYIKSSGQITADGHYIIFAYGLPEEKLASLQEKIEEMLGMNSTLVLQLDVESFKVAQKALILEDIKQEFNLEDIFFNKAKRQLVVEGGEQNVNTFREQFSLMVQNLSKLSELTKDEQELKANLVKIKTAECEICLMEIDSAYRLQACRHKFCLPCVNLYLVDCLKNISQFPLKCPKCSQEMIIQDLVRLLNEQQWQKLVNLSLNLYVSENGAKASFCFTPNCVYIFDPHQNKYRCPICQVTYCVPCKKPNHPGLTCEEAQLGIDILFKNYMLEVDARYCPNKSCGAILMKVDGCNKVECKNCHKAICWHKSCMIPFSTPDQCYDHLRKVHGGYYD